MKTAEELLTENDELITVIDHLCYDLAYAHLRQGGEIEIGNPKIRDHADAIREGVMDKSTRSAWQRSTRALLAKLEVDCERLRSGQNQSGTTAITAQTGEEGKR
jgi:hypothetical protein